MNKHNHLRRQATGLLIGYAVQFLAGMTLNLFITISPNHPGTTGNDYFMRAGQGLLWALSGSGGLALAIHASIALLLVLGSLSLFAAGLQQKDRVWSWCGGVAALFTLGALFNGLSFISYSHDFSSMIMATCWLVAVGTLVYGLLTTGKPRASRA